MPQLIAIENGFISLSFFAIAGMIFAGLIRDRSLGVNPLGIATGFIFFTCAAGHAMHTEHYVLESALYGGDPDLWHMVLIDGFTLAAGIGYLVQRRHYGLVLRGPHPLLDYQKRLQMAEALQDIGRDIAAQIEFEKLLHRVARHARDLLGADYAAIVTVDEVGKPRRQVIGIGTDTWNDAAWSEAVFLSESSRFPGMFSSQRPVVVDDLHSVSAAGWSERTVHRALGGRSVIAVPICRGEHVAGSLMVAYRSVRNLTSDDVSSVAALASQAAVAIDKARLIENLRQADRLKDEFLSAAAHELKTPVTAIKGWSELLLGDKRDRVDEHRAIQSIYRGAERVARLSEDLLAVMRLQPGAIVPNMEQSDLSELVVESVLRERQKDGSRKIDVVVSAPLMVHADRGLVVDALDRLLEHAARHSPASEPIEVHAYQDGKNGVVSVTDHGAGVPTDRRAHVFEPFYEAIPPGAEGYVGTVSLGLYLSKQIINSHGGQIWIADGKEGGSTLAFSLPLAQEG